MVNVRQHCALAGVTLIVLVGLNSVWGIAQSAATLTSISPSYGLRSTTVSANLIGSNLSSATGVLVSGSGVSMTMLGGGSSTAVPVSITISSDAVIGTRLVW